MRPRQSAQHKTKSKGQYHKVMIWGAHCSADAWLAMLGGGFKRGDELPAGQINHRVGQRCKRFEALQGLPNPHRQPPQRQVRCTCVLTWPQGNQSVVYVSFGFFDELLSPSLLGMKQSQAACCRILPGVPDRRLQHVVRSASSRNIPALSYPFQSLTKVIHQLWSSCLKALQALPSQDLFVI